MLRQRLVQAGQLIKAEVLPGKAMLAGVEKTLSRHCSIAFVEIVQQQLDQHSQVELLFLERISLSTKLRHVEAWLAAGSAVLPAEHRTGTLLTRVDT